MAKLPQLKTKCFERPCQAFF